MDPLQTCHFYIHPLPPTTSSITAEKWSLQQELLGILAAGLLAFSPLHPASRDLLWGCAFRISCPREQLSFPEPFLEPHPLGSRDRAYTCHFYLEKGQKSHSVLLQMQKSERKRRGICLEPFVFAPYLIGSGADFSYLPS